MANLDDQVMGLTGLTISGSSTAPSQTELSTYLKDGDIDVTTRCLALKPLEIESFGVKSSEQTANDLDEALLNLQHILSHHLDQMFQYYHYKH